ncbi:MAG: hypothetical protein J3Q66DRAFT_334399 [Benniella sp.]|nr:MAG: hypothetical protein J3Q66DRAFT_334399 [Benniella sp.]
MFPCFLCTVPLAAVSSPLLEHCSVSLLNLISCKKERSQSSLLSIDGPIQKEFDYPLAWLGGGGRNTHINARF